MACRLAHAVLWGGALATQQTWGLQDAKMQGQPWQKARPRLSSRLSPSPEQAWAESSCSPLGPCKEKPQGAQKLGKLRPEHGKKRGKRGESKEWRTKSDALGKALSTVPGT